MTKRKRNRNKSGKSCALAVARAALLACGVTVALVAAMTLLVYLGVLGEGGVSVAGAVLKILGAALAAYLAARQPCCRRGWLCGGLAGAAFTVLSTAAMCLLAGELILSWGLAGDVLMGFACGTAAAMLVRMFRKPDAA